MRWAYCDRWNGLLEAPIEPLADAAAKLRHENGHLYTAIDANADRASILVEVRLENGYVGVKFLDDLGRVSLVYSFRESSGQLFLRKIVSYDYGDSQKRGDRADPVVVETMEYTPDGICHHETDDSRMETIRSEDIDSVDVSTHWEPIPTFGDYASVTRWDRS